MSPFFLCPLFSFLPPNGTATAEVVSTRYYGMWQNSRIQWVPVAPGESRSASFPVWGIRFGPEYVRVSNISSGTYSCRATVRYKTEGPESKKEIVLQSEPVEIKYIEKEPND